ncbi:WD40-repeat-containing domain protein [Gorgonomyces haynaldii]|nr:WD40-repeat-containing domain protein [Gorgonomyces haynaldii]
MSEKVEVIFYSRQEKYQLPEKPILVPTKLKRQGLSEVVNHLLGLDNVPFDFIIDGKFLKKSLEKWLDGMQMSTENQLRIEFVESCMPPSEQQSFKQDDWIASIRLRPDDVLVGGFDGSVSIWNYSLELQSKIQLEHSVKQAEWLNQSIVVASDDHLVRVFEQDGTLLYECPGHQGSVESLAVNKDHSVFASGGWDKQIKLWRTSDPVSEGKIEKKGKKTKTETQIKHSSLELEGHSNAVVALAFDDQMLYSGSWDHAIRGWDIDQEQCLHTMTCDHPVTSLTYNKDNNLLVSGHSDALIRVWDPRGADGQLIKTKLTGHKNQVSRITWSSNTFNFASCSYDGTVKVWDLRSLNPMYSVEVQDKLFALDWLGDQLVVGGEDSHLHFYDIKL